MLINYTFKKCREKIFFMVNAVSQIRLRKNSEKVRKSLTLIYTSMNIIKSTKK